MGAKKIRRPLSKKERFDVFERDAFACCYCGRRPPEVCLEVDHVVPLCEGGPDDLSNWVTSCEGCNRGKGGRVLQVEPAGHDALRLSQEMRERERAARETQAALSSEAEYRQDVTNWLCDLFGVDSVAKSAVGGAANLFREFEPNIVAGWFDTAVARVPYQNVSRVMQYVHACARNHRLEADGDE